MITDQFSFQPELLFSLQGSKLESNDIEEQNFFDGSSIRTVANTTTDLTTSYINKSIIRAFTEKPSFLLFIFKTINKQ